MKPEPMAGSVHTRIEFNSEDAVLIFDLKGGARDGLCFAVPWNREQAKMVRDGIDGWLAKGEKP